jgi:gelsolin
MLSYPREVQGFESDLFMSYFNGMISIMEGGAETGFRHVPPECYEPRLLQLVGGRKDVVVG